MCIIERVVGCQRNSLQMYIIMAKWNLSFMHSTKTTRLVLSQQTHTVVTISTRLPLFVHSARLFCRFPRKHPDQSVSPHLYTLDSASYVDALTYSIRRSTDRRICCYMGFLFACKRVNYPDPFL